MEKAIKKCLKFAKIIDGQKYLFETEMKVQLIIIITKAWMEKCDTYKFERAPRHVLS